MAQSERDGLKPSCSSAAPLISPGGAGRRNPTAPPPYVPASSTAPPTVPDGFDFNDVRFYAALLVMAALLFMTWRVRRTVRAQAEADRRLGLSEAANRTGVVGPPRPVERERVRS